MAKRGRVDLRGDATEIAGWKRAAKARGVSLSALVRQAMGAYLEADVENAEAPPPSVGEASKAPDVEKSGDPVDVRPPSGVKPEVARLRELLAQHTAYRAATEAPVVEHGPRYGGPGGRPFTDREVRASVRALLGEGKTVNEVLARFPGQEMEAQGAMNDLESEMGA